MFRTVSGIWEGVTTVSQSIGKTNWLFGWMFPAIDIWSPWWSCSVSQAASSWVDCTVNVAAVVTVLAPWPSTGISCMLSKPWSLRVSLIEEVGILMTLMHLLGARAWWARLLMIVLRPLIIWSANCPVFWLLLLPQSLSAFLRYPSD